MDYKKALDQGNLAIGRLDEYEKYQSKQKEFELTSLQRHHCDVQEYFWRNPRYWRAYVVVQLNELIVNSKSKIQ